MVVVVVEVVVVEVVVVEVVVVEVVVVETSSSSCPPQLMQQSV